MKFTEELYKDIEEFCKDYDKEEISGIWILETPTKDGVPRVVVDTIYKVNGSEFRRIVGGISKCFTREAQREAIQDDYIGGALVYHLGYERDTPDDEMESEALMRELALPTTQKIYGE